MDKADYTQLYHPGGKISVATNLYAYKCDHDSQLQWPFKEEVTISMYYISMIICTTHTVNILHNGIHTYMHVYYTVGNVTTITVIGCNNYL